MSLLDISDISNNLFLKDLKDKISSEPGKCMDFFAFGQDILYVWNSLQACVHSLNVKQAVRDPDSKCQRILTPTKGILFTPDRIFLNQSCSFLGISSSDDESSGVAVIEIPERWMSEDNDIKVSCKNIAEKLFLGEQLSLIQAKWHPGSQTDSHILLLTSDECLRLYSVVSGELMWKCFLSQGSGRLSKTKLSLGDTPVDFDIGPPSADGLNSSKLTWPILVLWGNGDIYCVESSTEDSKEKLLPYGPLRMYPSSDDNYGSDANSILVLHTNPPVVAFSTCTGSVYNCLLLPTEEQIGHENSLYVFECIELELGISLSEGDDIVSCPNRMLRNPIEKSMYFLIHKAGIHSVTLPVVNKLFEFLESNETDFPPYLSNSIVEYLLCTGVQKESCLESLPLLGCAFVDLSSSLLILQNNCEILNIKITPLFLHSTQNLEELQHNQEQDENCFPLHIQSILKKNPPGPVIQLPKTDPQYILNIISKMKLSYKATMVSHEDVAKKLESKSVSLLSALQIQQSEIEKIAKEQEELFGAAQIIARRFKELSDYQLSLMCRMENILKNSTEETRLSEKEQRAVDYLESVEQRLALLADDMRRLENSRKHQETLIEERAETLCKRGLDLGGTRGRIIRKQLHSVTQDISLLVKKMKAIESSVPELQYHRSFF